VTTADRHLAVLSLASLTLLGPVVLPEARGQAVVPGPDFATIAAHATPAVVNISALQVYRRRTSPFLSDPFFRFFGRDFPFRVPEEERRTSLGSGVIVDADGLIVTNHHVIEQARHISVTLPDRRRLQGILVGSDAATDIAVLRITGHGLPTLGWGNSSNLRVGEYVLAIGNPFQLSQTVTMGIVSALGRSNIGIADYEDFIQTDAAINPGNSGGALVSTKGELIGINTAIYSESGGYQGIGFAVPSNLARRVVSELVTNGRVRRGFVGITQLRDVDEDTARQAGLSGVDGAIVWEMLRDSPADRAGLAPGDIIVEINSHHVRDAADLRNTLAGAEVGSTLALVVVRGRERIRLTIVVAEHSPRE
jgi:Do/DeqQ family serine protease